MRGSKEQVSRANGSYPVFYPIVRGPSGDNIEFVALMRHLRPICGLGRKSDFKIAVTKNFGRTPRRLWQRERGGSDVGGGVRSIIHAGGCGTSCLPSITDRDEVIPRHGDPEIVAITLVERDEISS
jgi:hypothetical protein